MTVSLLKVPAYGTYYDTKFDSAAHEVLSILADSAEGYGIDACGDVESPWGFFQLLILDDNHDTDFNDFTNYPRGDYAGEVARLYGLTSADVLGNWMVKYDDRGSVYCEQFDTPEQARQAFACQSAAFGAWSDEDEDHDGFFICPIHGYELL